MLTFRDSSVDSHGYITYQLLINMLITYKGKRGPGREGKAGGGGE
jgi:hypothetical protein